MGLLVWGNTVESQYQIRLKPCFKVRNLVYVYPKSIKLGQMKIFMIKWYILHASMPYSRPLQSQQVSIYLLLKEILLNPNPHLKLAPVSRATSECCFKFNSVFVSNKKFYAFVLSHSFSFITGMKLQLDNSYNPWAIVTIGLNTNN